MRTPVLIAVAVCLSRWAPGAARGAAGQAGGGGEGEAGRTGAPGPPHRWQGRPGAAAQRDAGQSQPGETF